MHFYLHLRSFCSRTYRICVPLTTDLCNNSVLFEPFLGLGLFIITSLLKQHLFYIFGLRNIGSEANGCDFILCESPFLWGGQATYGLLSCAIVFRYTSNRLCLVPCRTVFFFIVSLVGGFLWERAFCPCLSLFYWVGHSAFTSRRNLSSAQFFHLEFPWCIGSGRIIPLVFAPCCATLAVTFPVWR